MCYKNRAFALIYRLCVFAIEIIALIYDFGIFKGIIKISNLLYFTILSNMFCCILFLWLSLKTGIEILKYGNIGITNISAHIKGSAIMCILTTMLVYHFILIPYAVSINPYQKLKIIDIVFHYIVPFMTVFDWILFDEKSLFSWYDPLLWLTIPYIYVVIIFVQARFEFVWRIMSHMNKYIYIFLDVGTIGLKQVTLNIINLTIAFLILGYFIYGVDRIKLQRDEK